MATSYLICFFARFAKAQHQILGLLSHYGGAREFVSHRLFFQRRKILLTLSHSFMLKFVTLKITALLLPNKLQSQRVNYLGFQVCPQAAQCLSPRRQVEEKSPLKLALESYQPGGYGCGSADDDEDQQCYNLTTLSPPPRPTLVTAAAQKEEANTQVFRPENNFFPSSFSYHLFPLALLFTQLVSLLLQAHLSPQGSFCFGQHKSLETSSQLQKLTWLTFVWFDKSGHFPHRYKVSISQCH